MFAQQIGSLNHNIAFCKQSFNSSVAITAIKNTVSYYYDKLID